MAMPIFLGTNPRNHVKHYLRTIILLVGPWKIFIITRYETLSFIY